MKQAGGVVINLNVDADKFFRAMRTAERLLRRFNRQAQVGSAKTARSFSKLTSAAHGAGIATGLLSRNLNLLGAFLAGAAIYGGVRAFAEFEATMNNVLAVSQANTSQFALLNAKARELGSTTKFTAGQVAEAMSFMAMAGLNTQQIYGGVEDALTLAAAGNMELGRAADIVTNIMTALGLEAKELGHSVDVLTGTFTKSNTSLDQLGFAFTYAAPIAKAAGISFEETSAALGLLGNAGFQGTMAGTALRGALIKLIKPSNEAAAMMKQYGIEVKDANGKLKPLAEILEQFEPHTNNLTLFAEVFAQRAGPGMINLVNQGSDALRQFTANLEAGEVSAKRIAETQMQGLKGAFIELKSAAEGLAIAIGESGLGRALEDFTDSATSALRSATQGVREMAPLQSQSLQTLESTYQRLRKELAALDNQAQQMSPEDLMLGFEPNTEARRKAINDELDQIREYIRLQRLLQTTGDGKPIVKKKAAIIVDPEDLGGGNTVDVSASKRKAALTALQNLESEYLQTTKQNRRLIEVESQREFEIFKKLLADKLISQEEFEEARQQLGVVTATKLRELTEKEVAGFKEIGDSLASNLEGAFRSFVETGKLDFQELTRSILADIATITFRALILKPLLSSLGGGSSVVGVAHMGSNGPAFGMSGGRRVDSSAFIGAPRFHSGLASDEMPAIIQRGETIIPKGGSAGGGQVVNIYNNAGVSVEQQKRRGSGVDILDVTLSSVDSAIAGGRFDTSLNTRFTTATRKIRR